MRLNLDQAEVAVFQNDNYRWDNYTLCIFKEDAMAEYSPSGSFVYGKWGYETRIDCDAQGVWTI